MFSAISRTSGGAPTPSPPTPSNHVAIPTPPVLDQSTSSSNNDAFDHLSHSADGDGDGVGSYNRRSHNDDDQNITPVSTTAAGASLEINTAIAATNSSIPTFAEQDVVEVDSRTCPGMNKPGGTARITKVHASGNDITYDVKYIIGGDSEKNVDQVYIMPPVPEENRSRDRKTRGDRARASILGQSTLSSSRPGQRHRKRKTHEWQSLSSETPSMVEGNFDTPTTHQTTTGLRTVSVDELSDTSPDAATNGFAAETEELHQDSDCNVDEYKETLQDHDSDDDAEEHKQNPTLALETESSSVDSVASKRSRTDNPFLCVDVSQLSLKTTSIIPDDVNDWRIVRLSKFSRSEVVQGPNDAALFSSFDHGAVITRVADNAIPSNLAPERLQGVVFGYIEFLLEGSVVLRSSAHGSETCVLLRGFFPDIEKLTLRQLCLMLRRYWKSGERYYGQKIRGILDIKYVKEHIIRSEFGWVGDNEGIAIRRLNEQLRLQNAVPHFSELSGADYSATDVTTLKTLGKARTIKFLRGLSSPMFILLNQIRLTCRNLVVDHERSNMTAAYPSTNSNQESASRYAVVHELARTLANSCIAVDGLVSRSKGELNRLAAIESLTSSNLIEMDMELRRRPYRVKNSDLNLCVLAPSGKFKQFDMQLKILIIFLLRVFSAKDALEMADVYSNILWLAKKMRSERIITKILDKHRVPEDISVTILSFVFPAEYSVQQKCIRHGCDAVAAPHPDPRRRKSLDDILTCNSEACSMTCAWYQTVGQNVVRCSANRQRQSSHKFCGGGRCKTLFRDNGGTNNNHFDQVIKERVAGGEKFA